MSGVITGGGDVIVSVSSQGSSIPLQCPKLTATNYTS